MKKIFNKTLSAIVEIDEAVGLLKTEMIISDSSKIEDLQIVSLLDDASKLLVESITVFARYKDLL